VNALIGVWQARTEIRVQSTIGSKALFFTCKKRLLSDGLSVDTSRELLQLAKKADGHGITPIVFSIEIVLWDNFQ